MIENGWTEEVERLRRELEEAKEKLSRWEGFLIEISSQEEMEPWSSYVAKVALGR